MPFLLLPFFCILISCDSYKTPQLPSFSDDQISYEDIMEKRERLREKIKKTH